MSSESITEYQSEYLLKKLVGLRETAEQMGGGALKTMWKVRDLAIFGDPLDALKAVNEFIAVCLAAKEDMEKRHNQYSEDRTQAIRKYHKDKSSLGEGFAQQALELTLMQLDEKRDNDAKTT